MVPSKNIVLDTNFLMIPAQFKVDIFDEIERICNFKYNLCILDKTLKELERLSKYAKGKVKREAKLALDIIKTKDLKAIPLTTKEYTDDALVNLAKGNYIVATQDIELKRKLKKNNVHIITLRQKKYLIMI